MLKDTYLVARLRWLRSSRRSTPSWRPSRRIDRNRQVLKIDYDSAENPDFLIRDILDELVEIVPRVYLGKVLVRFSEHIRWLGAYFALQPPAPGSP